MLTKINGSAEHYFDLSHFKGEIATPPLLGKMETLNKVERTSFRFDAISCHSQAVEQTVTVVSQAAESKIGYESRHRTIFFFVWVQMLHREVASLYMAGHVSDSHLAKLSFTVSRPRIPFGWRYMGQDVVIWSAVCSSAPHSQDYVEAMPH